MTGQLAYDNIKNRLFFLTGGNKMIAADILSFFFLLYLITVKYPGEREKAKQVFKDNFSRLFETLEAVIGQDCFEGFCSLEDCDITLQKINEKYFLIMDFHSEEEAKIFAKALSQCRVFDSHDLLKFGINPEDLNALGAQVNELFKSDYLDWKPKGKIIEIKIGTD